MMVNVVRVFVNETGEYGNPVGIVLDEDHKLSAAKRQKVAAAENYSETVFIDSLKKTPAISIFNPQSKVNFSGYAVLGTIHFLSKKLGRNIDSISCGGKIITVRKDGETPYVQAPLSIMPHWNYKHLDSAGEVEKLSEDETIRMKHTFVWAWINEKVGLIRARTFASDWGIKEDEANGSGSMLLASKLNRKIKVIHGKGSVIFANPVNNEFAEVGGICTV